MSILVFRAESHKPHTVNANCGAHNRSMHLQEHKVYVGVIWSLSFQLDKYICVVHGKAVVENGHQKDTCYKEIGLRAQNIDTIVGSVGNTIERAGVINQRQKRIVTFGLV